MFNAQTAITDINNAIIDHIREFYQYDGIGVMWGNKNSLVSNHNATRDINGFNNLLRVNIQTPVTSFNVIGGYTTRVDGFISGLFLTKTSKGLKKTQEYIDKFSYLFNPVFIKNNASPGARIKEFTFFPIEYSPEGTPGDNAWHNTPTTIPFLTYVNNI
jgi:hypothetical protein